MTVSRRAFLTMAGSVIAAYAIHEAMPQATAVPAAAQPSTTPLADRITVVVPDLSVQFYADSGELVGSRFAVPDEWNVKRAHTFHFNPITVSAWDAPPARLCGLAVFFGSQEIARVPIDFSYAYVTPGDVICVPCLTMELDQRQQTESYA